MNGGQSILRQRGADWVRPGLLLVLAIGAGWHAAGAALPATGQQRQATPPAPACTAEMRATPSQTEGPFYKSGSPPRTSLVEPNMAGTKLIVTGYVLSRGVCKPVAGAWLDFWQADGIFTQALLANARDGAGGKVATFNFIVDLR